MEPAKHTLKRLNHNDYDLDMTRPLGKDGSGNVYSSKTHPQVVAKKIVCDNSEKTTRMKKGLDIVSGLIHPNVVEVIGYDVVEVDETVTVCYLFMERAQSNLKEFMMAPQNADFFKNSDNFVLFMLQMIKAGAYLEAKKIIHGGIKPENILVFTNNLYKLADTGFAKQTDNLEPTKTDVDILGYRASEIARGCMEPGKKINIHLHDVYAMGVVLLEVAGVPCSKIVEFNSIGDEVKRGKIFDDFMAAALKTFEKHCSTSQLFTMMMQLNPKNRSHFSLILSNFGTLQNKYWRVYFNITGKQYEKYALLEDSTAQYNLGLMYYDGHRVEKSYEKAVHWYQKAAEQGEASALNDLGMIYWNGQGVERNYEKAVQWCQKAADQGNPYGQYNFGMMYYNGQGVEKNYEKAAQWYQKAAEQGEAWAQNHLGMMYEKGQGVEKNYEKAVQWYQKAADQGNASGQYNLGSMYENGEGVVKSDEKAVQWYQKAAEQGDVDAQFNLGVMHYYGAGLEESYDKASKWFRDLCIKMDNGVTRGQLNVTKKKLIEVMPRLRIIWDLSIKMREELIKAASKQTNCGGRGRSRQAAWTRKTLAWSVYLAMDSTGLLPGSMYLRYKDKICDSQKFLVLRQLT